MAACGLALFVGPARCVRVAAAARAEPVGDGCGLLEAGPDAVGVGTGGENVA